MLLARRLSARALARCSPRRTAPPQLAPVPGFGLMSLRGDATIRDCSADTAPTLLIRSLADAVKGRNAGMPAMKSRQPARCSCQPSFWSLETELSHLPLAMGSEAWPPDGGDLLLSEPLGYPMSFRCVLPTHL